jgi:transposase-like protein
MGKKGGTKRYFSKEYKLSVVKRNIDGESSGKLARELGLDKSLICHWAREYRDKGEAGLETKRHPGNPLLIYQKQRRLSVEDKLRYELAKKDIELAKLKKLLEYQRGNARKGN